METGEVKLAYVNTYIRTHMENVTHYKLCPGFLFQHLATKLHIKH